MISTKLPPGEVDLPRDLACLLVTVLVLLVIVVLINRSTRP